MFRTSAVLTASAIFALSYGVAKADFTAYNDLGGTSSGNVTSIQYNTNLPSSSATATGTLVNYANGASTGVTLTVSTPSGFTAAAQDTGASNGALANAGTDVYSIFNGKINGLGYIYYNDQVGASATKVRLTFSGLNTSATYEVAIYGNRNGNYTDRYSVTSIAGADSYTNTSSAGATIAGADTTIMTGNNSTAGYVAKYSNISAGSDGSFYVDVTGLGAAGAANFKWYVNALALTETSVPEPASLSLIGLAGLAMLKRRRSL